MKLARRVISICFFMSTLAPCDLLSADEVTQESREAASRLAAELIEIFDLVLDHHVHPVTKQQMAHDCLAHAHQQLGSDLPADLVKEISQTVDHDGFRRILQRELTAMFDHNHRAQGHSQWWLGEDRCSHRSGGRPKSQRATGGQQICRDRYRDWNERRISSHASSVPGRTC